MNRLSCAHTRTHARVSPTCVGMNLFRALAAGQQPGKPHVRGDEPASWLGGVWVSAVSPTCVGMNLGARSRMTDMQRKPHVRGDEPQSQANEAEYE